MPSTYADYLMEGARKLSTVEFDFAVKMGLWDATYWYQTGGVFKGAKVLRLKPRKSPTRAVQAIFDHPELWSFDCSQFCQVVSFYAQMKTLNAGNPRAFDRQIVAHKKPLEIKPFRGAYFMVRKHYYRREAQTEWLKYRANTKMEFQETRIGAWDLVRAAPVGSRVNFNVGAGGFMNFENVIKAQMDPLTFIAQGIGKQKVWKHDELLIRLAQEKDPWASTLDEAAKLIWIREVAIFQDLPLPPHRARGRARVCRHSEHRFR